MADKKGKQGKTESKTSDYAKKKKKNLTEKDVPGKGMARDTAKKMLDYHKRIQDI